VGNRISLQTICFRILFLGVVLSLAVAVSSFAAGTRDRERILVGLDLFPSLLAADRDIARKVGSDGKLHLFLIYRDDPVGCHPFAEKLRRIGTVRNIPIQVDFVRLPLRDEKLPVPAGVFVLQHLSRSEIGRLVRFGTGHGIITFSPFAGDVEAGILAGIFITDRVLPYVNLETVQRSSVRLKPFFLRIAKTYAPDKAQ
jgi:hypothetical protein